MFRGLRRRLIDGTTKSVSSHYRKRRVETAASLAALVPGKAIISSAVAVIAVRPFIASADRKRHPVSVPDATPRRSQSRPKTAYTRQILNGASPDGWAVHFDATSGSGA
jgi:hypothetical protein